MTTGAPRSLDPAERLDRRRAASLRIAREIGLGGASGAFVIIRAVPALDLARERILGERTVRSEVARALERLGRRFGLGELVEKKTPERERCERRTRIAGISLDDIPQRSDGIVRAMF